MGEEKTATNFVLVSLLMLTYFLINPLLVQGLQQSQTTATSFTFQAVSQALRLEKELAKAISFMVISSLSRTRILCSKTTRLLGSRTL
jgi:hypothetical protein